MSDPSTEQLRNQVLELARTVGQLRREASMEFGRSQALEMWLHAVISALPNPHDAGRTAGSLRGAALTAFGDNAPVIQGFRRVDEDLMRRLNKS